MTLASSLLARASLRLAWSDGDPHSRGTVLDPAELVGEHVRFLPGDHDAERLDLGLSGSPRFWDGDFFGVGYQCAGNVRGESITAADVAHLVRALLGLTEVWPAWARPVAHGAVFLLVDSEPRCLRHGNSDHREAWVCRVWLDVERTAVDLRGVDWAEVERERARMELEARKDEQRAMAAREETRRRMVGRRRAEPNRPNDLEAGELSRNPSHDGGILSQSGSTLGPETFGAGTPTKLALGPKAPPVPMPVGRAGADVFEVE